MFIPRTRPAFQSFGDPIRISYEPALVTSTLAVSPPIIGTTKTTTVTFTGSGTTWLGTPPTFTPTGVSGVSTASLNVISDTSATLDVTTGTSFGTITWTDSTTSKTATELVQFSGMPSVNIITLPHQYYAEPWR